MLDTKKIKQIYKRNKGKMQTGPDKVTVSHFARCIEDESKLICKKYLSQRYKFTKFKSKVLNKGRVVYIPTIRDKIVLAYLNNYLQNKYSVSVPQRNDIIKSLITVLKQNINFSIIRLDIKSFYDSISHQSILSKLLYNQYISDKEYYLVKECLNTFANKTMPPCGLGLPQGLSISSILSEIEVQDLDTELKLMFPNIIFYIRYVDDILIVLSSKISQNRKDMYENQITSCFGKYGFKLNQTKFKIVPDFSDGTPFEYLGYSFSNNNFDLKVDISSKKLNQELTKLAKIFYAYEKNRNYHLLYERLSIQTRFNYMFSNKICLVMDDYDRDRAIICFGFLDAYRHVNKIDGLDKLDRYIKANITRLKGTMSRDQRRSLFSLSFCRSIEKKFFFQNNIHKYTKSELIGKINRIRQVHSRRLNLLPLMELQRMYFAEVKLGK